MSEELDFVLQRLGDEDRPVRNISLAPLSGLTRDQMSLFRSVWVDLKAERRFEVIAELVEQAEANVHLNFCTVLRNCLHDADARVRKLAVEGLWEDCKPDLVSPLVSLLEGDPSTEVRAAAAISLGRFVLMGELGEISESAGSQAAAALRAAWFRPQEVNEVRRRALEGMAYTDEPDVQEFIRNAYYDEDEQMRQSAVFAMGSSGDRRWSKSVLTELGSPDAAMRFEAASAAGELALSGAVRPLVRLLDDPDSSVREAAALALGQIGGPQARRALQAVAAGEDERLAQAAEDALQELSFNSETADQPLLDFSDALAPKAGAALDDADDDEAGGEEAVDGSGLFRAYADGFAVDEDSLLDEGFDGEDLYGDDDDGDGDEDDLDDGGEHENWDDDDEDEGAVDEAEDWN
jgi:HEAT repeat protein